MSANIGYGAKFGIEGTTPGVYVDVAMVVSITPPAFLRDTVDVTHLESAGRFKQFVAGMNEGGDAQITLNFVPSATDVLVAAFTAVSDAFQITFPNGVRLRFTGIVTNYEIGELSNDKMTATLTIKPSGGAPVLMAAA